MANDDSYKGVSPALMGACAEKGIGLCFLTQHGRFLVRIAGPVSGNVLLRETQYARAADEIQSLTIAKSFSLRWEKFIMAGGAWSG